MGAVEQLNIAWGLKAPGGPGYENLAFEVLFYLFNGKYTASADLGVGQLSYAWGMKALGGPSCKSLFKYLSI